MTAEPTQPAADIVDRLREEADLWGPADGGARLHTEAADEIERLRAAAAVQVPVAWIRVHPDGTYSDDLLPNWQIERVRRESGAWIPLSLAASATPPPEGAPPESSNTLSYARSLADSLWRRHYKADSPDWKPLDDVLGLLTQIDNMTVGLTRAAPPEGAPVAQPEVQGAPPAGSGSPFQPPSGASTSIPSADVLAYLKGCYAFLESTSPAGFALEVFRLPPSATQAQTALFDALQGVADGEIAPATERQDSGHRQEDCGALNRALAAAGAPVAQALRELVALYDQRIPLRERPEAWEAARAALSPISPGEAHALRENPWRAAHAEEARKFQQETLRTSELSALLREFAEHYKVVHGHDNGWLSRGCTDCDLVKRAEELLARPINAALSHQPVGSVTPADALGAPSGPGSAPSEEPSGT